MVAFALLAFSVLLLPALDISPQAAGAQRGTLQALAPLSEADEISLARAGGPAALVKDASVWIVGRDGRYKEAVKGTNGWGCLVQRGANGKGLFPRCDDSARVATLYPVFFLLEEYRSQGKSADEYTREVERRYRNGSFRPPPSGAVAYMYAEGSIPPHVMVAAPYCPANQMGVAGLTASGDSTVAVDVLNAGRPDCDLIIYTPAATRREVGRP